MISQTPTAPSTTPPSAASDPTISSQAGKVLGHLAGYVAGRTIELGLEHGLFEALASEPTGLTAAELADVTGTDPAYAAVWCRSGVANELLDRHDQGAYRLAPHMATLLLDAGSPTFVGGTMAVLAQPEIFDHFGERLVTGARTWWDRVGPAFIDGVAETGGAFYARLIPGGLAQVPGLAATLEAGACVLDSACGAGVGLVRLAETYARASIVGADGDAYSLEVAASRVRERGLERRVELLHTPLESLDRDGEFDLVTNNISMHESRDIEAVVRNVARALRPDGWFVISDFPFPDTDEGLRTVPGRIMSGIQFFEAQIDDQLLPVSVYVDLLERHGFRDIGTFRLNPVHAVTYGRRP